MKFNSDTKGHVKFRSETERYFKFHSYVPQTVWAV
jgi:hypothetical protein